MTPMNPLTPMNPIPPPAALRARVLAAAAATPAPTRREGQRRALVLLGVSVVAAGTVFELAGGLAHSAGRPLGITLAIAGGWMVASALLTWLVVGRGGSTLARPTPWLAIATLLTPVAAFLWLRTFHGTYAEPYERVGHRCLGYTLAIAATPLAAFLRFRRGIEPRRPSALGAAAGAVSGAWAGLVVDLWCPLTAPAHAIVGHALPLVLLIGVGAVLGGRTLGVRTFR
jgi:hypothetical protein